MLTSPLKMKLKSALPIQWFAHFTKTWGTWRYWTWFLSA